MLVCHIFHRTLPSGVRRVVANIRTARRRQVRERGARHWGERSGARIESVIIFTRTRGAGSAHEWHWSGFGRNCVRIVELRGCIGGSSLASVESGSSGVGASGGGVYNELVGDESR